MQTIVNPQKNILELWGKQRVQMYDDYRFMKYVLRVDYNETVLLHNMITGQLVALDEDEINVINNLPTSYSSIIEQLVTDRYLVPLDFEEYKSVNQLRKIFQIQPDKSYINHFVILPTTFCNARCFYCYESDYPHVHMTEETAQKIIDFINVHRKEKEVSINWFGGEPLVGIQRIDQIAKGLQDLNIPFSSSMVSNGYLFDEHVVDRCVDLWNLRRIQITLDGTEKVYKRVKAYVNIQDNPFQRVLRNIDLLSNKNVQVNIRLNIDFYNKDDIQELIELLGKHYSGNKFISVYLNMLFNDAGFEPVNHSYDDMIVLSDLINKYTDRVKELNLAYDNLNPLHLMSSQCMADNPHSIMIQPDGSFCRCEHENILDGYGNLDEGITDFAKLDRWKELLEPSKNCPDCSLYPTCYRLKNCMNADMPCIEKFQLRNINKQKERIIAMYVHHKEVKVNESI